MIIKRTVSPLATHRSEGETKNRDTSDLTLRPQDLKEYIGQGRIKEHLLIHIAAARERKEPLGHTLLHGPPGLGKTTLAFIIAREMRTQIRVTSGPAVEKAGDLAALLTNLQGGDVLFIDEIHRLRPQIEEVLYGAMEESVLDIMIGKGPTARSVRLNLQPFTLVGATTRAGAMSAPLRDRFIHTFKLDFYTLPEMQAIAERAGKILSLRYEERAAYHVARASRATPRISNRLVRAVRDFAQVQGRTHITEEGVLSTLRSLGIDHDGLDAVDRQILSAMVETFGGGPVGLSTLAAFLSEEEATLEDVYEPYLLQQGYVQRTSKGRIALQKTYEKLGLPVPESVQAKLFG